MNKKGVSIMIGYVLLISIAIILGVVVFNWMKSYVPSEGLKCPADTSLVIDKVECLGGAINVYTRNNGLHNVTSYFIKARTTSDSERIASTDIGPAATNKKVPLSGNEAPGDNYIATIGFDIATCTDLKTKTPKECLGLPYCAGIIDCDSIGGNGALCTDTNGECKWDGTTCSGKGECSKLDNTKCISTFPYGCSWRTPITWDENYYTLYKIQIIPERQQKDKNDVSRSVSCNEAIINKDLVGCNIYAYCGNGAVEGIEVCDSGTSCLTDCTCPIGMVRDGNGCKTP